LARDETENSNWAEKQTTLMGIRVEGAAEAFIAAAADGYITLETIS